jgi:hypothetical protein
MERYDVRYLVSMTMLGRGTSGKNAPSRSNHWFFLLLKYVVVDKQREEEVIQQSSLNWTIARALRLTNNSHSHRHLRQRFRSHCHAPRRPQ